MKELEDRGWEAMSKLLDTSLPQKKRYFIKLWELLTLVGMTGIVVLMFNWNSSKNQTNITPLNGNTTTVNENKSENGEVVTLASKEQEQTINNLDNEQQTISNSKSPDNGLLESYSGITGRGGREITSSANTNKEEVVKLDNLKTHSDNTVANIQNANTSGKTKKSELDQNRLVNITPEVKKSEGKDLALKENLSGKKAEVSTVLLMPLLTMSNLNTVIPTIQTSLKITNNKFRPLALYIKGGAFIASNSSYSGLFLSPELTYKIGNRSNLFINGQVRYKRTQAEIIYNEFASNVKTYIESNVGSIAGSVDIPAPDKVNVNTFDIGLDLGYRFSVLNRLSVGVFGFYRYNNLLDQAPVNAQYVPVFDPNSLADYQAFETVSSSVKTYNPKYNYGAGLDLNYRLGSRSLLFSSFNKSLNGKQNYEITLGYGFRLF